MKANQLIKIINQRKAEENVDDLDVIGTCLECGTVGDVEATLEHDHSDDSPFIRFLISLPDAQQTVESNVDNCDHGDVVGDICQDCGLKLELEDID